ncbi:DUF3788 family protein [Streptomyces sp. NPDC048717]|uniref:DUF3788 family protein n=1 Tax=Streptomyces sp. NPDC048717 TaxID=3154928 RepID=UPI00341994E7
MANQPTNPFTDPDIEPAPALIADALGPAIEGWDALTRALTDAGVQVAWRWYRDGGWLAKAADRRRTIAWIAIEGDATRCSFHFAERLRDDLASLPDLPPELTRRVREAPRHGALFTVSFLVSGPADVERLRPILNARITLR